MFVNKIVMSLVDDYLILEECLVDVLKKCGVIDLLVLEKEIKKVVEKYVENKKGENFGKEVLNGD